MNPPPIQPVSRPPVLWNNCTVTVRAHSVPRLLFTSASIDVYLDGDCILRSGGKASLTGGCTEPFTHAGAQHQVDLRWGHSRWYRFPYEVRIDGQLVDQGVVPVENWYVPAGIYGSIGAMIGIAIGIWLMRNLLRLLPGIHGIH